MGRRWQASELDERRALKMVSQHSDESFCGARMHGRDIRDRAGGLAGGDCRGNEVDDLSGMRADCYASQKALRFGVDVAI